MAEEKKQAFLTEASNMDGLLEDRENSESRQTDETTEEDYYDDNKGKLLK